MGGGGAGEGQSDGGIITVSFGSSEPSVELNGHGDGGDVCSNRAAPISICFVL